MQQINTEKLVALLACPHCNNPLLSSGLYLSCIECVSRVEIAKCIDFLDREPSFEIDALDNVKTFFKRFPRFYMFLSEVVSPVYISKRKLRRIIQDINANNLIGLNIGSGVTNYSENIINFDLQKFKNVEVLGDLYHLPFGDNSFDYVFSVYVLEHVPDTQKAINEMFRVLKPGGKAYCLVPFIQGFHAAPADFSRLTISGIRQQFVQFDYLETEGLGPTSALLWIFQEWLALVLSFGNRKIGNILHIVIMVFTFPIKYLDVLLSHYPSSEKIAVATEVIARKNA